MFYLLSEIIERVPSGFKRAKGHFIFKPATLNIEWLSILSQIEPGDELEMLWCVDSEVTETLMNLNLHYDCARIVIHKADHRQYHVRIHTQVGDDGSRLIKLIK